MDKTGLKDNERKGWILLVPILFIAFFLRLHLFQSFSLTNDELSAWIRLQHPDFRTLIQEGCWVDGHPAGVQIFLYYWTLLFGDSPFALRLPFALMGSLAILFAFLFTRRIAHTQAALFVAGSMAVLEFPLLYSSLARPYASGQLFAMLNAYAWALFFFPKDKHEPRYWAKALFLGIAFALQLYNHYFSALLALIMGLSGFVFVRRKNLLPYLAAALLASLLYAPHIPISLNHFSIGGVGEWLGKPGKDWPYLHILHIFNDSLPLLLMALALVIVLRIAHRQKLVFPKELVIIILWFALPLSIGFLYSKYVNPVLQHSVLVFSMPFFLVGLFYFLPSKISKLSAGALLSLLFAFSLSSYLTEFRHQQHFEEFADIPLQLEKLNAEYGSENITHVVHTNNIAYVNYFQDEPYLDFAMDRLKNEDELLQLKKVLDTCTTPYFCLSRIQFTHHLAQSIVLSKYPWLLKQIDYDGLSRITLLSKHKENTKFGERNILTNLTNTDSLTSRNEFSPGFEVDVQSLAPKVHGELLFDARFTVNTPPDSTELLLVLQIVDAEEQSALWTAMPAKFCPDDKGVTAIHFQHRDVLKPEYSKLKAYLYNPKGEEVHLISRSLSISTDR